MTAYRLKTTVLALILLTAARAAMAETACVVAGQVGYCTPPVPTEFSPTEEEYIAQLRAMFINAGYTLFTVVGNTGWTTPYFTPDYIGGASRYTYLKGETAWGTGASAGTGQYYGVFYQTREFRCLWDDGVGYDVIQPWQNMITQCFHKNPTSSAASMSITPDAKPTIPASSRVAAKKVLTRDNLALQVRKGTVPAAGLSATIQSDRAADTITQSLAITDSSGGAIARVETRDQSTDSRITSASSEIQTQAPGVVKWLPATFENQFLITCYVISEESDYASSPLVGKVEGLPVDEKFRSSFLADVRLQGSGKAANGKIIHYDGHGKYSVQSCARTATGACAVDGVTIAVDKSVIPLNGTVDIASIGSRNAKDTGGAITGNHIDVYYGTRRNECRLAGRRNLAVDFVSY